MRTKESGADLVWSIICTPPADAASVMAADEALWSSIAPGDPPVICMHDFESECVTLGFAQSPEELASTGLDHLPWARRLTGGGAIHHTAGTVSFGLIARDLSALGIKRCGSRGRAAAIACAMGEFLVAAWKRLGVDACVVKNEEAADQSAPLCADRLYPGDVVAGDVKVAGIGQRHRRGRLLVQAALMLDRVTDSAPARSFVVEALHATVAEQSGAEMRPAILSREQRELAGVLRASRYLSERWNRRQGEITARL